MPEQATLTKSVLTAQNAYKQKDFEDAAYHVAGALAQDPLNSEILNLFDNIINEAPHLEMLVPLKENSFYGELIARAYIDSKLGHYRSAVSLIIRVLNQFPDIGLEKWLPAWIADARFRNIQIDIDEINGFLSDRLNSCRGRLRLRAAETEYYSRFTQIAYTLVKYFPETIDVMIIASNLLRRSDLIDDAIQQAQDSLKKYPDPDAAVALGLAYRTAGQYNRAVNAYEQAFKLEKDPAFLIEMAHTRWDAGGHKAALKYLNKALKKDETLAQNTEFNCMLRYLKNDKEIVKVLGNNAKPDDIKLVTTPLVGYLFSRKDYTVNIFEQVPRDRIQNHSLQITTPGIEPPSVRLALALATTGNLDLTQLDYTFHQIPEPDPRYSTSNPTFKAWIYDEETNCIPIQAVSKPDDEIYILVNKLANQAYYLPHWWQQAKQLMKNNSLELSKLIGTMVYPEAAPENFKSSTWITHSQLAAALLIAATGSKWYGSLRREILLDLLHGPIDWITDSVLIALTEVALDIPESTEEIAFEFEQLARRAPEQGHWSLCAYLPLSYRRLPARSGTMIAKLSGLLARYTESAQHNTA